MQRMYPANVSKCAKTSNREHPGKGPCQPQLGRISEDLCDANMRYLQYSSSADLGDQVYCSNLLLETFQPETTLATRTWLGQDPPNDHR